MSTRIILLIAIIGLSQTSTWNYSNPNTDWPTVISTCNTSTYLAQSPIDIIQKTATINTAVLNLSTSYSSQSKDSSAVAISILNAGGHALKVAADYGKLTYDSKTYKLLQFHFHQPSEHLIDGNRYDMEMHMVHQIDTGAAEYLVVGYLFNLGGEDNKWLKDLKYSAASATSDISTAIGKSVNPWTMMEKLNDQWAYMYEGSFTTPPCTEGVHWFVMREVGFLSRAQWNAYKTALPTVTMDYATGTGSYRPAQAINTRTVTLRQMRLDNKSYLSAGQIAGIVIGSICGFLLVVGVVCFLTWMSVKKEEASVAVQISENVVHDDHKIEFTEKKSDNLNQVDQPIPSDGNKANHETS